MLLHPLRVPVPASPGRRPASRVVSTFAAGGGRSRPGKALADALVRRWEPKRLRPRVFAVAGRLARSGRRLRLRLAGRWPWAGDITVTATRLQALPSG